MATSTKITHIFHQFYKLGGIHTLLRLHSQRDTECGIDSKFIITWEKQDRPQTTARVFFLGIDGRHSLDLLKHRFQIASDRIGAAVCVYHSADDVGYLVGVDQAKRRLLILHVLPNFAEIRRESEWFDGILCISPSMVDKIRSLLPDMDADRIQFLPLPISPPETLTAKEGPLGDPLTIGYAGRMFRNVKRVDLIPEFYSRLQQEGIRLKLELVGDGPDLRWLKEKLPASESVVYHGALLGADYWRVLRKWDLTFCTSDAEAGPLTILEGMRLGVIPVFPKLDALGDHVIGSICPELLFTRGSVEELVQRVLWVRSLPGDKVQQLRRDLAERVSAHSESAYLGSLNSFIQLVQAKPKVSSDCPEALPFGVERLSFESIHRIIDFRMRVAKRLKALTNVAEIFSFMRRPRVGA